MLTRALSTGSLPDLLMLRLRMLCLTLSVWSGVLGSNIWASENSIKPISQPSESSDFFEFNDNFSDDKSLNADTEVALSGASIDSALPVDLAQITSVDDLGDVLPTDWAYTALQSLVEQYQCLEGYPDRTFRGDRPLTRYEFAAGLNACLDNILAIASGQTQPPDASITRLQQEFADELATLSSRVDALEAATAELRAQQFSTTTRLRGRVFAHLNGGLAGGDIKAEGINAFVPARDASGDPVVRTIEDDPEVNFSHYTWLDFATSFTGEDLLNIQFAVGDGRGASNTFASAGLFNTFGTPFTLQTGTPTANSPVVRELFYTFPVGDRVTVTAGARVNWYRYFDNNRFTFLVTGANSFNSSGGTQVNAVDRGAGVVVEWDVTDNVEFTVGYLAENTEFLPQPRGSSDPERGLFGGTNTLTAQLALAPIDDLNLRFLYTRSNLEPNASGFVGGAVSEPLYGFADDGFGGPLETVTADTFLFNFDWQPFDWLGLFGRYSYGSTHLFPATDGRDNGDVNAQSLQLGLAFPDLFKEGASGNISYVRPFAILDGRDFLISGGGDGGVQQEIEITYRYPINNNIAVVPSVYWIDNANNFSSNPDVWIFNLQTQIAF